MLSITPFRFEKDLVIIDPEILTYPILKDVYDRTKDNELRIKYFTFIYHTSDPASIPLKKGYSEKETINHGIRISKLENHQIPNYVIEASKFYRTTFVSVTKELSIALLRTMNKNVKILEKIDDRIDRILQNTTLTPEQTKEVTELQKDIINIAMQLPKQITTIKEIEKLIIDESENNIGRGKIEITDSMDGDDDLEQFIKRD